MKTNLTYYSIGNLRLSRGTAFGTMIITALLFFEMFNFSTTDFALQDLLGELSFLGLHWATILAVAFCAIDFAGIARIFTPEEGSDEPAEVWYLFGAWLLAATMNAMLTWWGVSIALLKHLPSGSPIVPYETLLTTVPIFVAVLVWLTRVLLIGTFSVAGERLFSQAEKKVAKPVTGNTRTPQLGSQTPSYGRNNQQRIGQTASSFRSPQRVDRNVESASDAPQKPEPAYHPVGMSARGSVNESRPKNYRA